MRKYHYWFESRKTPTATGAPRCRICRVRRHRKNARHRSPSHSGRHHASHPGVARGRAGRAPAAARAVMPRRTTKPFDVCATVEVAA